MVRTWRANRMIRSIHGILSPPVPFIQIQPHLKNCLLYFDKNLSTVTNSGTFIATEESPIIGTLQQSNASVKPTFNTTDGLIFSQIIAELNVVKQNTLLDRIYINPKSYTMYFRIDRDTNTDLAYLFNGDMKFYFRNTATANFIFSGDPTNDFVLSDQCLDACLVCLEGDGVMHKMYKNGVEIGSRAYYSATTLLQRISTIGRNFTGKIKQIAIYNKKLSAEEKAIVEAALNSPIVTTTHSTTNIDCVIALGQSNMTAVGGVNLSGWPSYLQSFSNCMVTSNSNYLDFVPCNISDLDPGFAGSTGFYGFEMQLGYNYYNSKAKKLYVIKQAVGSTYLEKIGGANGWWFPEDVGWSVTNMLSRSLWYWRWYLQRLILDQKSYTIKACLWAQGENDAMNLTASNNYQTNLTNLIAFIRNFWGIGNLPFVIYQINKGTDNTQTYWTTIKSAQEYVAANTSNVYLITNTANYTFSDPAHFDKASLVTGGDDAWNILNSNNLI